jgi:hypothetical protein
LQKYCKNETTILESYQFFHFFIKDELKGQFLLTVYQSMFNQDWETTAVIFVVTLTTKPVIFIKVLAGGRTQARPSSPTSVLNEWQSNSGKHCCVQHSLAFILM